MHSDKQPTAIICLSPNDGGMELDAIKLAKTLSSYTQITIIAKKKSFIEVQKKQYEYFNGIVLETVDFSTNLSLSLIKDIRMSLIKHNIQNIIFFGASELKSIYFSLLNLNKNLIVRHGTTKSKPKKDFFHKLIYSNVNYHVSISKHLLQNVRHIIPFGKNSKEKLIYSSFSSQNIATTNKNSKLSLLHVGRIVQGKGQVDAIKACKILVDNNINFEFNIVGEVDKEYKKEFLNFYNTCSYKKNINLVGFTNNVKQYLEKANIFIFPSYGEGLGNAFLEALSSGLVCISYKNTTFVEFKELGFNFHICNNKDIADLSKKLLYVAKNIDKELEISSRNHQLSNQIFSKKNELQEYMEILI